MRPGVAPIATACLAVAGCAFDTSGIGSDPDAGGVSLLDVAPSGDGDVPGGDAVPGGDGDVVIDGEPPGSCEDDEAELPFEAANVGRCVPAPEDPLDVPHDQRWRLDTDRVTLDNLDVGLDPPPIETYEVIDPADGPELLVVTVTSLRVRDGATLEIRGDRALAIVSTGPVDIDAGGVLSAAAEGATSGPGVADPLCEAEGGRGGSGEEQIFEDDPGGSGGGGGGFGAPGGEGAHVDGSGADPSAGGAESDDDEAQLVPLRGGCRGGDGFQVDPGTSDPEDAGVGGGAGGALQLVAAGRLRVRGTVTASGGGGRPGIAHSGGGGGGSGGALLLEARSAEIDGALTANGGGGGEGMRRISGSCSQPSAGADGEIDSADPAGGGSPGDCPTSGAGGDGGAAAAEAGQDGVEGDSESGAGPGAAPAGGGGGGGGVGRIRVDTCDGTSSGAPVLSPGPVVGETLACD